MPDVHSDGVVVLGVVVLPPNTAEQLLRGDHLALVFAEGRQQGELGGRQGQGRAVERGLMVLHIDDQAPAGERLFPGSFPVVAFVPPQLGFHPGHQLQGEEGLGDVVVRPQGQAVDFVQLLPFGGEHDHRVLVPFPDAPAQLKAADFRQHHV